MKTAKLLYTQVLEKAQQISAPQNDYDINFLIKVGLGIIILLTIGFALYQWYRKSQKAETITDEILREYGPSQVVMINQKYTAKELDIINIKRIFKERTDHWEMGYKVFGRVLTLILLICAAIGYLQNGKLIKYTQNTLSPAVLDGYFLSLHVIALFNIGDIGRIFFMYHTLDKVPKTNKNNDLIEKRKRIIKETKILLEEGGMKSAEEIVKALNLKLNASRLGCILKQAGFLQKRKKHKRNWMTKNMDERAKQASLKGGSRKN